MSEQMTVRAQATEYYWLAVGALKFDKDRRRWLRSMAEREARGEAPAGLGIFYPSDVLQATWTLARVYRDHARRLRRQARQEARHGA